jgi:hypothetical protein
MGEIGAAEEAAEKIAAEDPNPNFNECKSLKERELLD